MANPKKSFVCQECGSVYSRWAGKCDACGTWDKIVEEAASSARYQTKLKPTKSSSGRNQTESIEFVGLTGTSAPSPRLSTNNEELNRVLGGGMVKGSAVLIGGDPGIGKSTLLLQAAAAMAQQGAECIYISGEESTEQVRLRAARMGVANAPVKLASSTSVADIVASLSQMTTPNVVIIDSIQTLYLDTIESSPGTVSQVRASAHELIQMAKQQGFALILVGHVTKEGQIAGPKVLEHMVDTVLYFEGDRGHHYRILRAVKNRFGPANEIGVFEMREEGLMEVANPSALFISERRKNISGSAIFVGMEGTRPILAEVQALVSPTYMATPRRAVVGWDTSRLAMIIAVLQTRFGAQLGDKEVYLNVAGGLRITEPAVDLAVAAALISSLTNTPLPQGTVLFGEIGLSGEVRKVSQPEVRLREAEKLGFSDVVLPHGISLAKPSGMSIHPLAHIKQLKSILTAPAEEEVFA